MRVTIKSTCSTSACEAMPPSVRPGTRSSTGETVSSSKLVCFAHAPWWPSFQPWSPQKTTTVEFHSSRALSSVSSAPMLLSVYESAAW